ncbi:TAF6-like RNA polymerase II p300/CBP-associated factor-associated factor 65 kDa subunit 6L [Clavelina lepadiformis]|uniref:TAF6-like RNA polymerase II p300/CBP-associated factor-associated factor 65 kDa subunit 6L n=1 Tax=Clavelina lepadiformis TaxID=159417 RepID=UPI0040436977
MSSSSPSDERKFAIFSPSSIQNYAESIGISNLPESILQKLGEDISYRLREITSKSCEFMRHSRRGKLKASDIDRAMRWSNIQLIKGAPDSTDFRVIEQMYVIPDPVVDLQQLALDQMEPSQLKPASLSTEWLSTDDPAVNPQNDSLQETTHPASLEQRTSEEYTMYYSTTVECILSDNKPLFQEMLKDISSNPRIGHLVPYFVDFFSQANLISHNLNKLMWMLQTINALCSNSYISLQLYLKPLMTSVLYCVVEPLAASMNPLNDHWVLRDYGARLLAKIVYSYPCKTDMLMEHLFDALVNVLSDSTKPLCSHYGALVCIAALGTTVAIKLLPVWEKYISTYLQPVIDVSAPVTHLKEDGYKVYGAIVRCFELLHCRRFDANVYEVPNLSSEVNELLGDAFVVRLPLHKFEIKRKVCHLVPSVFDKPSLSKVAYQLVSRFRPSTRSRHVQSMSDVFQSSFRAKRHGCIKINYGKALPTNTRRRRLVSIAGNNLQSSSNWQYDIVRTVTFCKQTTTSNTFSFLF